MLQFKLNLMPNPDDERAEVVMIDQYGTEDPQKLYLEGTSGPVDITLNPGHKIVVQEIQGIVVPNPETMAGVKVFPPTKAEREKAETPASASDDDDEPSPPSVTPATQTQHRASGHKR